MRIEDLNELREKQLINGDQHHHVGRIITKEIFSVYYELRILLYLGVILVTTGIGILIYKNIGDLGHMLLIGVLSTLTATCFWYVFKFGRDYTDEKVKAPTPYFDYIVLLGSLLFISVLTYLQLLYEVFNDGMGATTLVTAAFFFYIAYRFDHVGVLSLAVAALASFWSISISPQKWYSGDFVSESNLYNTAIIFGVIVACAAIFLDKKRIKTHFTFTYINFCSLIYLVGALTGMFINDEDYFLHLLAVYAGCAGCIYFAHLKKSFLFLLYAFVFGYIATTFLIAQLGLDDPWLWFMYLKASCGGFVFFIIRYKNYFKRAE
jgi:hypothetical protein